MHSFLVQSTKCEVQSRPDTLVITGETSIGIAEVRQIQAFLSRKPIQAERNTIYIVGAHLLTVPAQNALLKTLEEPPGNAEIYLVTAFSDLLLPTILSRVQVLASDKNISDVDPKKVNGIKKLLEEIQRAKVGERLELVDAHNFTRDSALEFLNDLEHFLHANLDFKINYDAIVQTRKYLQANVNVKLVMDNLFLEF